MSADEKHNADGRDGGAAPPSDPTPSPVPAEAAPSDAAAANNAAPPSDAAAGGEAGGEPGFTVVDRRFWVQGEEEGQGEQAAESPPKTPSYVEKLEQELAQRDQQLREYLEAHRSAVREFEAARARIERDRQQSLDREKGALIAGFFEVFDNLQHAREGAEQAGAAEAILAGIDLVIANFLRKLEELGVQSIAPLGAVFDPQVHEALSVVPASDPSQDGRVVFVMRTGFQHGARVLRPALVVVARTATA